MSNHRNYLISNTRHHVVTEQKKMLAAALHDEGWSNAEIRRFLKNRLGYRHVTDRAMGLASTTTADQLPIGG